MPVLLLFAQSLFLRQNQYNIFLPLSNPISIIILLINKPKQQREIKTLLFGKCFKFCIWERKLKLVPCVSDIKFID